MISDKLVETSNDVVEVSLDDYPIFCEFPDVFYSKLPGLSLKREVGFHIELVPRAQPVSREPYRMTNQELNEIKVQLEEILEKSHICPSLHGVHL